MALEVTPRLRGVGSLAGKMADQPGKKTSPSQAAQRGVPHAGHDSTNKVIPLALQ
jgi:hypothetical protein